MQVKYKNFAFYRLLSKEWVGVVFLSSSYDFIAPSQIMVESFIIIAKYFSFSQLHIAGFQAQSFSHTWISLH